MVFEFIFIQILLKSSNMDCKTLDVDENIVKQKEILAIDIWFIYFFFMF